MRIRKLLAVCTGLLVVSIFSGIIYEAGPIIVRPFDIGLLVVLFVYAGMISASRQWHVEWNDLVLLSFLSLALYIFVNSLLLVSRAEAVLSLIQNVEYLLVMVLIADLARRPAERRIFIRTLIAGFGAMAVLVAIWHITNGYISGYKLLDAPKAAFGLFALFAAVLFYQRRNPVNAFLFMTALLLLLLSMERKSWVAFVGALIVVIVARQKFLSVARKITPRFWVRTLATVVVSAGLVMLAARIPSVSAQIESLWNAASAITADGIHYKTGITSSNAARLYALQFGINAVQEHPFFGIGAGKFKESVEMFSYGDFALGAHNEYLRVATEFGLTGLILYIIIWVMMLKRCLKLLQKVQIEGQEHRIAVLIGVALAVYGMIINAFLAGGAMNVIYLVLPAGLLLGLSHQQKIAPKKTHSRKRTA